MESYEWVVLSYTLPREPSRARVAIWRRLKKLGAFNMQQSLWMLPLIGDHAAWMRDVRDEVVKEGGEAFVMTASVDGETHASIVLRFNRDRDEEYRELLEQCADFLHEIDKETERKNFSFAEIEENEEELRKLREWRGKIKSRDCFGASLAAEATHMLECCVDALERFCTAVYASCDGI